MVVCVVEMLVGVATERERERERERARESRSIMNAKLTGS